MIQRDIPNATTAVIRKDVINQNMESSSARPWHAESRTGMLDISMSNFEFDFMSLVVHSQRGLVTQRS